MLAATPSSKKIKIFFCYARVDQKLRDRLEEHLSHLKRLYPIQTWFDRQINPGENWEKTVEENLNTANMILLLISPAFLASDYCYNKEMKRAIDRHNAGEVCVIPIILRPSAWQETPFSKLQVLPFSALPVTMWRNRDQAFYDIAQGIKLSIEELQKEQEPSTEQETHSFLPQQAHDIIRKTSISRASTQESIIFGIDLGSTYSRIAYVDSTGEAVVVPNNEGDTATPSFVQFDGNNRIVGIEAKECVMLDPENVVEVLSRNVGDISWHFNYQGIEYRIEEIYSYILRKLILGVKVNLELTVEKAVITCPAYFTIGQRQVISNAAEIAGLTSVELLNPGTAAAIGYAIQSQRDQTLLIYSLGGCTFGATVVEIKDQAVKIVAIEGDTFLGGRDWDGVIVAYLVEQWKTVIVSSEDLVDSPETLQDLWLKAEQAKINLTIRNYVRVPLVYNRQRVGVNLTRAKFDELTMPLLDKTIILTARVMNHARLAGINGFDRILLTGGSTRMPQITERLKKEFDIPLEMFDPARAVVKGAAIYGKYLAMAL
jgi:hypothetical protein